MGDEVVEMLKDVRRSSGKPVWIELGLQTIQEETARFIRRGYELPVYDDAVKRLRAAGLEVIVHVILGLLCCVTIVGIPWGLQHFKMAVGSILPFGKEIR